MTLPSTPSFRCDGKRALVTGASSGIGAACAAALAEAGAHVVLAARRLEALKEVEADLTAKGWHAESVVMDVADLAAVESFIDASDPFDILLNSAGMARNVSVPDVTHDDFDRVTAINIRGAYFLTRAVALKLRSAGKPGSLINISSQMGHGRRAGARRSIAAPSTRSRASPRRWPSSSARTGSV